jgi:putative thioredoxin
MPILLKLAEEYQGRFKLSKINTDTERELAAQHAVRSLPTLRLYQHGEVVEEVLGAQAEIALRKLIDAHIERASDRTLAQAIELAEQGNVERALQLMERAYRDDPSNPRLPFQYARLAMRARLLDRAQELLSELPAALMAQPESDALKVLLELARQSGDMPSLDTLQQALDDDPRLIESRYQLAICQALAANYQHAIDNFMEILKRDRNYRDGVAQRALVALFTLLGGDDDRVAHYRRQMFNLLH